MKIPKVMDLQVVQQLSNMLRSTDLSKINAELLNLPSLPNMADFHRFRNELKTSLPSVDFLPSLSTWNGLELLRNCLPKHSIADPAKDCILVMLCFMAPSNCLNLRSVENTQAE